METNKKYIVVEDLEVYSLSRELSRIAWNIYGDLDWKMQKVIVEQFIRSTDSIGANIAEGYSRFHYLDKIKFYYNARASFSECYNHWLSLLIERKLITSQVYDEFSKIANILSLKLNNFITATYRSRNTSN